MLYNTNKYNSHTLAIKHIMITTKFRCIPSNNSHITQHTHKSTPHTRNKDHYPACMCTHTHTHTHTHTPADRKTNCVNDMTAVTHTHTHTHTHARTQTHTYTEHLAGTED